MGALAGAGGGAVKCRQSSAPGEEKECHQHHGNCLRFRNDREIGKPEAGGTHIARKSDSKFNSIDAGKVQLWHERKFAEAHIIRSCGIYANWISDLHASYSALREKHRKNKRRCWLGKCNAEAVVLTAVGYVGMQTQKWSTICEISHGIESAGWNRSAPGFGNHQATIRRLKIQHSSDASGDTHFDVGLTRATEHS